MEEMMAIRIDTVTARNRLKIRREPYWHRISKGFHVGFRRMSESSKGSWMLRYRNESNFETESGLGPLDEYPAHEMFDQAVRLAHSWLSERSNSQPANSAGDTTLWAACIAYVSKIEDLKGVRPAKDLAERYRRWVEPDPIRNTALSLLCRDDFTALRRRIAATPVRVNKAGLTRARSKDSVNRDIAAIRAALNQALADRKVLSDFAWRAPLQAFKNVSKRRSLYLDLEQRRSFVQHAPSDLAAFLRGLSTLPLRPGSLAALTVEDFDPRLGVLTIGKDKSGQDRKIKLPALTAKFIEEARQNRDANAPLLARVDGQAWNKDSWKGPVKATVRNAGLPAKTTAYTLRHSVISDLVHGGLDLLTVAQISGTSVAMIEKHYGHLRSEIAAEALSKLAI